MPSRSGCCGPAGAQRHRLEGGLMSLRPTSNARLGALGDPHSGKRVFGGEGAVWKSNVSGHAMRSFVVAGSSSCSFTSKGGDVVDFHSREARLTHRAAKRAIREGIHRTLASCRTTMRYHLSASSPPPQTWGAPPPRTRGPALPRRRWWGSRSAGISGALRWITHQRRARIVSSRDSTIALAAAVGVGQIEGGLLVSSGVPKEAKLSWL